MIENIAYEDRGLIRCGQRIMAAVRIAPSLTSPSAAVRPGGSHVWHVGAEAARARTVRSVVGGDNDNGILLCAKLLQRVKHRAD